MFVDKIRMGLTTKKYKKVILASGLFDVQQYLDNYPDVKESGIDPVSHYLWWGYKEGRNPSSKFDTKAYLKAYPDVNLSGVNPLVHYILHGQQEGREHFEIKLNNNKENQSGIRLISKKTVYKKKRPNKSGGGVLVSCYLAVEDPIIDILSDVCSTLENEGIAVTFVGSTPLFKKRGFKSLLRKPFHLSDYSGSNNLCNNMALPWFEEVVYNEVTWKKVKHLSRSQMLGLEAAVSFWNSYFYNHRPSHILIWGSTAPLSKLLLKLAVEFNIGYTILERGHFPNTLLIDPVGQGKHSAHYCKFSRKVTNSEGLSELIEWFESNRLNVPYSNFNSEIDFQKREGRKLVVYLGSNDIGSGTETRDPFNNAGVFPSTHCAIKYFANFLCKNNEGIDFVIKPHPSDKADYTDLLSDSFILADKVNVNRLIELADVCISTTTTAFASCVMMNKPVLSLGLNEYTGKDMFYDCYNETEIPTQLRMALSEWQLAEKLTRGKQFLVELFQHHLVGGDSVPTAMKANDLSRILRKKVLHENKRVHRIALSNTKEQCPVGIIVPVYGDYEATKNCLDSLRLCDIDKTKVFVISDCSPFEEIEELLSRYEDLSNFTVVKNDTNLGFTGTVNKGIFLTGDLDVVILNSDTIVSPNFAQKLQQVAYKESSIGSVTPLSNNASIFSVEVAEELDLKTVNSINKYLEEINHENVKVPVGHGFCMFVKRALIERVGLLDEITFGKGYSEEVDFCLRASKLGYRHYCAANTFVAHVGGVSFSDKANQLRASNREIIRQKYPGYFDMVKRFNLDNPISKIKLGEK